MLANVLVFVFFFNDTATTEIYTLSLHDALPISKLIENRVEKNFNSVKDKGDIYHYNDIEELKIKDNESYYFLARNNCFLNVYKNYLMKESKLFKIKHKLSYDKKEINAINIYEEYRKTKVLSDINSLRLNKFLNKDINCDLPWYQVLNFDLDKTAYYRDLIKNKIDFVETSILVNTIHGVKGGEADNVVIALDFTKSVKENFEHNTDAELRCLYVAFTRAKNNLYIIHSTTKNGYDSYLNL